MWTHGPTAVREANGLQVLSTAQALASLRNRHWLGMLSTTLAAVFAGRRRNRRARFTGSCVSVVVLQRRARKGRRVTTMCSTTIGPTVAAHLSYTVEGS